MILDWKTTLVIGCLLVQVSGQEFQRFNSEPNHPIDVHRPNSIQIEGRDYREISDKSIELNYIDGTGKKILIPSAAENSHELGNEDEKLLEVIVSKDYDVSTPWDIERFDRIGERMIARANITEDAKRVVRQVKKQRPGFFWTLARVAFEVSTAYIFILFFDFFIYLLFYFYTFILKIYSGNFFFVVTAMIY